MGRTEPSLFLDDGAPFLTASEATAYCIDHLALDPHQGRGRSGLALVDQLMARFLVRVPFQSISVLLRGGAPTLAGAKRAVLAGEGGLCFTTNVFMQQLLDALDFDATFAACRLHGTLTHYTVLVRGLDGEGSVHCVDPGCGHIMPRAMALPRGPDPATVYSHGHLTVRWTAAGAGPDRRLTRWHLKAEGDGQTSPPAPAAGDEAAPGSSRDLFWTMNLRPQPPMEVCRSLTDQLAVYRKLRVALARGPHLALRGYREGGAVEGVGARLRRISVPSRAAMVEALIAEPELAKCFDRAQLATALSRVDVWR